MDDARVYGGAIPGGSLQSAQLHPRCSPIHGPPHQNQVRLPHHHGGGEEVTESSTFYMLTVYFVRVRQEVGTIEKPFAKRILILRFWVWVQKKCFLEIVYLSVRLLRAPLMEV